MIFIGAPLTAFFLKLKTFLTLPPSGNEILFLQPSVLLRWSLYVRKELKRNTV